MAKFVIKKSSNDQYYFYLQVNSNIVVTSETYTTKQSCKDSIESVKKNAADATIEDTTVEKK